MKDCKGLFDPKLLEIKKQFFKMENQLALCQNMDKQKLKQGIKELEKECLKNAELVQDRMKNSRSTDAAEIAAAQNDYFKKIEKIVNDESLESLALYAEYAVDFAVDAMDNAVLAAFKAMVFQNREDEEGEK